MIYSPRRRFLFIHIPKTGGTSLSLALEARAAADDILVGDTPKARRRRRRQQGLVTAGRLWKHSRLADLAGLIGEDDLEQLFVFTLVRNPWDRVVSYYHWLRAQSFDHPAVRLAQRLDFAAFLRAPGTLAAFANDAARAYVTDWHGRERCGLFLRLEALGEDLPRLEAALGFRLGPLPHVNRSERPDYRSVFDEESREIVATAFAEDIARFGYRFG